MDEMIQAIIQRYQQRREEMLSEPPEEYDRDSHVPNPDSATQALQVALYSEEISEGE